MKLCTIELVGKLNRKLNKSLFFLSFRIEQFMTFNNGKIKMKLKKFYKIYINLKKKKKSSGSTPLVGRFFGNEQ